MKRFKVISTRTRNGWVVQHYNPPLVEGKPFTLFEPLGAMCGFTQSRCRGHFASMQDAKSASVILANATA